MEQVFDEEGHDPAGQSLFLLFVLLLQPDEVYWVIPIVWS